MIKIRVEGQGVYLKEAEWDAFSNGTKVEADVGIGVETAQSHLGKRTVAAYENNFENSPTPTSEFFT